jgi:methionyl-tRNA synthetase
MPASPARTLFVTTALPYANGPFHIGHIMEYIQADIWVRFQRMQGHHLHFVCADDTHGAPIMLRAEAEGITPEELIARVGESHRRDWARYHISFDTTHSTHSPENVELAQSIYRALNRRKLITTKTIAQFYDPIKGMFLPDRYIKGTCPKCGAKDQFGDACEVCGSTYAPTDLIEPYSTLTGATPEMRQSEHLFFRLSAPEVVGYLKRWTAAPAPGHALQPEMFNKVQEWLGDDGKQLTDWDISRDAPYFGIEVPDQPEGAPKKYFYVWLDAPVGYLAALKKHFDSGAARALGETRPFDEFIADPAVEQYHFIGKDIVYFHTLFWPAMLHFSDRKTPTNIFVHGFITFSGEKMSKSRGTGISPQRYIELGLDPEWLRYYIAAKLNARVEDLDFGPDDFVARVNSDLIGKYVNIASRAATFISRHFDGRLATPAERESERKERIATAQIEAEAARANYDAREFGKVLRDAMRVAQHQRGVRCGAAVAARQGSRTARAAADGLLARAAGIPAAVGAVGTRAAAGNVARCARTVRPRARFRMERCLAGAGPDRSVPAPDDADRSPADRRAARHRAPEPRLFSRRHRCPLSGKRAGESFERHFLAGDTN